MKEIFERYMHHLRAERRLSPNSLASYERDLLGFLSYAEAAGLSDWREVNRSHLSRYVFALKEQGRKAATISRHIVSLRSLFHYLTLNGLLTQDPSIHMESPKPDRKPPAVLSIAMTNALLDTPCRDTCSGKRDKAMLELLYATGIRVSELVALNLEHIDTSMRYIQCAGRGGKERIVPFGSHAAEAVTDYLRHGRDGLRTERDPDGALFLNHLGTRMTRQGFWKMLKKYVKEAGIGEPITPHSLRASVAAHLLDNGADIRTVQELLGHADIATTLKYTQFAKSRMRDVYAGAHPRA